MAVTTPTSEKAIAQCRLHIPETESPIKTCVEIIIFDATKSDRWVAGAVLDCLKTFLAVFSGIPTRDTSTRLLSRLALKQMQYGKWCMAFTTTPAAKPQPTWWMLKPIAII